MILYRPTYNVCASNLNPVNQMDSTKKTLFLTNIYSFSMFEPEFLMKSYNKKITVELQEIGFINCNSELIILLLLYSDREIARLICSHILRALE